jgi:hypothetical protein
MAMKENPFGPAKEGRKTDTGKLAAQLAPLEEQNRDAARKQGMTDTSIDSAAHGHGVILVESSRLPKGVMEGDEKKRFLGIEPVVLVIVTLMLAFIAFIAWQVSEMPPNP